VEYGALTTAPGPLLCEAARLYCFFIKTDPARVQALCDKVLSEPTGGELRYRISRLAPVVLSLGSIGGLRSLAPSHSGRGSAFEPEAAIWIPTMAQRRVEGGYRDEHLAVFMPYIWVDDPIAFAAGREVYGFAKSQGWMADMGDPRHREGDPPERDVPDPPDDLHLDVYGTETYHPGAELGNRRLITVTRAQGVMRGLGSSGSGDDEKLADVFGSALDSLDPQSAPAEPVTRSIFSQAGAKLAAGASVAGLLADGIVHHVFLKQFRDAAQGERAVVQQVVEAQSTMTPGSLRWRRLGGAWEIEINRLVTQPLEDELGVELQQRTRLAFAVEFGFRMDPGEILWPR
jgi:hypothetical protein